MRGRPGAEPRGRALSILAAKRTRARGRPAAGESTVVALTDRVTTGRVDDRPKRRAATLVSALVAAGLASAGCMPWAVGQTAETVRPGGVEPGLAVTAVAPPSAPGGALVAPQAWARVGALEDLDVGLTYAVPLTFQADGRWRFRARRGHAVAAIVGAGAHGTPVPERLGLGPRRALWTSFALVGLVASARGDASVRPYGSLRAFAPFVTEETFALTVWGAATAGVEWSHGGLRLTPELGAVIPSSHPEDTLLTVGLGARWTPSRPRAHR